LGHISLCFPVVVDERTSGVASQKQRGDGGRAIMFLVCSGLDAPASEKREKYVRERARGGMREEKSEKEREKERERANNEGFSRLRCSWL